MIVRLLRKLLSCTEKVARQKRRYACLFGNYLEGGHTNIHRSVRFNVKVRSDGHGQVTVDANTSLGYRNAMMLGNGEILLQARTSESLLTIDSGCRFSNNIGIIACERVSIGQDCLIGDGVMIFDSDFHAIAPGERHENTGLCAPVYIGRNVWLGSRAIVLKGVTIGENSIIAPMSVVTRNIEANVVAAGIPARKVRAID